MTALPPEDQQPEREPWAKRKPYTYSKALGECGWNIAGAMCAAAGMCVCLAALGVSEIANAVIVAVFGPVGCTVMLIGRVQRKRRGLW